VCICERVHCPLLKTNRLVTSRNRMIALEDDQKGGVGISTCSSRVRFSSRCNRESTSHLVLTMHPSAGCDNKVPYVEKFHEHKSEK
jgi:hypothetical protein